VLVNLKLPIAAIYTRAEYSRAAAVGGDREGRVGPGAEWCAGDAMSAWRRSGVADRIRRTEIRGQRAVPVGNQIDRSSRERARDWGAPRRKPQAAKTMY